MYIHSHALTLSRGCYRFPSIEISARALDPTPSPFAPRTQDRGRRGWRRPPKTIGSTSHRVIRRTSLSFPVRRCSRSGQKGRHGDRRGTRTWTSSDQAGQEGPRGAKERGACKTRQRARGFHEMVIKWLTDGRERERKRGGCRRSVNAPSSSGISCAKWLDSHPTRSASANCSRWARTSVHSRSPRKRCVEMRLENARGRKVFNRETDDEGCVCDEKQLGTHLRAKKKREDCANILRKARK